MERKTVQLRVAGQSFRVVTTADEADLLRFVSVLEAKIEEVDPRGRIMTSQALLLAALALVHDLEQERQRADRLKSHVLGVFSNLLSRVDSALAVEPEPPPPPVPPPAAPLPDGCATSTLAPPPPPVPPSLPG